jgi:hypothetical protein
MSKGYVVGKIRGHTITVGMSAGAIVYLVVDIFKNVKDASEEKNVVKKGKQIPVNLLQLNTVMKDAKVYSVADLIGVMMQVLEEG